MSRLGNNTAGISSQTEAAIKAIKAGDTESQRAYERKKRLIGGLVGTVGTIGQAVGNNWYENDQRKSAEAKRKSITDAAIAKTKAASAQVPTAPPGQESQAQYMQNAYAQPLERDNPYGEDTKAAVKNMANDELNHIAVNDAAEKSPIQRTWGSGPAFAEADANAQGLGTDINTSQNMMKQGGMMGSVNTGIDRNDPYAEDKPYDESKEF